MKLRFLTAIKDIFICILMAVNPFTFSEMSFFQSMTTLHPYNFMWIVYFLM